MAKKYTLAKHQVYASEMMDTTNILALFYEAGTGKTMCVLDWLYRNFKMHEDFECALIVCPANLVSNWRSAIDKMSQFEGYTDYGIRMMHKRIEVRSFQRTYQTVKVTKKKRDGTIKTEKEVVNRPDIQHNWSAIIVDESQGLGAHNSSQTESLLKLSSLTTHRYILSGTPVSGGGGQEDYKKLYGQLKFLDPDLWPNWTAFCRELVVAMDNYHKPKVYRNDQCLALMKAYGIVARLDDCYDMPDYLDIPILVDIGCPLVYNEVVEGFMKKYNIEIKTGGGKFIKLMELVSGFMKNINDECDSYDCNKAQAVADIINGTDDKVVIFCNYRYSIDQVEKICKKHGKTVVFDGRSTTDTWRDFQFGDARYLICQYQSGGTGIDLFASHTMIFYEPSFSSLLMEQAKARIRRKGQNKKCLYYWLTTKASIEEKVVETVRNGVDASREMLNEWAKEKTLTNASASLPESQMDGEDTAPAEETEVFEAVDLDAKD